MARVNAAYAKGDLTALEVMSEQLGAGEPPGELGAAERRAHLERRTATLARIAASLARERARLVRSDTHRLREEALRAEAAGEDFLSRSRAELAEEAEAAFADAQARLSRLTKVAREVARARSIAMKQLEKRGPTGARRAFDPLQEAELVRMGAARLERSRATSEARDARADARGAGGHRARGGRAHPARVLRGGRGRPAARGARVAEGWSLRWDRLRAAWPGVPDLPRALARLPRWLAVGARAQGDEVVAGVQLADAALVAGVRIALERGSVASLARDVLAALGPELACEGCGARGAGLHLHRTRGLDELHGLVCPACGATVRSYWRYGEVGRARGARAARAPARARRRGHRAARRDGHRLPDAPRRARAAHRGPAPPAVRRPVPRAVRGRAAAGRDRPRERAGGARAGSPARAVRPAPLHRRGGRGAPGRGAARAAPRAHRAAVQAVGAARPRPGPRSVPGRPHVPPDPETTRE